MKKISVLTATRADYGKIKPILRMLDIDPTFSLSVFVTGMHMVEKFGITAGEVMRDGFGNIILDEDYRYEPRMDVAIANVIISFSRFIRSIKPDMIMVHGDRLDALAGAMVGAFNNVLVAHVEGGEISGTIDESIRHAVSKFAHLHFVANAEAQKRLIQMGEPRDCIHTVGSPDIDIMLSESLPDITHVLERYDIPCRNYAILIYHPVLTEKEKTREHIRLIMKALKASDKNYVAIFPNNDPGNEEIRRVYEQSLPSFTIIPSMRFEYFLSLLKHAEFIVGNSSAGIREACVYGTPAIDIGSRQSGRYSSDVLRNVSHVSHNVDAILTAIGNVDQHRNKSLHFGSGNSAERIHEILNSDKIWNMPKQKQFQDLSDWTM